MYETRKQLFAKGDCGRKRSMWVQNWTRILFLEMLLKTFPSCYNYSSKRNMLNCCHFQYSRECGSWVKKQKDAFLVNCISYLDALKKGVLQVSVGSFSLFNTNNFIVFHKNYFFRKTITFCNIYKTSDFSFMYSHTRLNEIFT